MFKRDILRLMQKNGKNDKLQRGEVNDQWKIWKLMIVSPYRWDCILYLCVLSYAVTWKKSESLSRPDHVLSEPIGITCNCPHLRLIVLTFQPLLIYWAGQILCWLLSDLCIPAQRNLSPKLSMTGAMMQKLSLCQFKWPVIYMPWSFESH